MVACRTIWISDFHLGTRLCQAEALLGFLRTYRSETLYLVGDILDGWAVGRGWYWSADQDEVVDEIRTLRAHGVKITFIPGNHDEAHLPLFERMFGNIPVKPHVIHTTIDGCRMLVIHGHQFDGILNPGHWFAHVGSWAYQRIINRQLRRSARPPRGAERLRRWFERWTEFGDNAVKRGALQYEVDGVICGHLHHAEIRQIGPVLYCNAGDWATSCSAVIEDWDGSLSLVFW